MAAIHTEHHPDAGRTVRVRPGVQLWEQPRKRYVDGSDLECVLQDWADRLLDCPWKEADAELPVVFNFVIRAANNRDLPLDDDVVGIRAAGLSHLVHVSELVPA